MRIEKESYGALFTKVAGMLMGRAFKLKLKHIYLTVHIHIKTAQF